MEQVLHWKHKKLESIFQMLPAARFQPGLWGLSSLWRNQRNTIRKGHERWVLAASDAGQWSCLLPVDGYNEKKYFGEAYFSIKNHWGFYLDWVFTLLQLLEPPYYIPQSIRPTPSADFVLMFRLASFSSILEMDSSVVQLPAHGPNLVGREENQ